MARGDRKGDMGGRARGKKKRLRTRQYTECERKRNRGRTCSEASGVKRVRARETKRARPVAIAKEVS
jgi:hypothetical protein